nr:hypothetical protein [Streptomyces sp. S1D4-11]QIY97936.1 hypothetical protein HEP87_33125 [Streptomyces sp. S1D4-11]
MATADPMAGRPAADRATADPEPTDGVFGGPGERSGAARRPGAAGAARAGRAVAVEPLIGRTPADRPAADPAPAGGASASLAEDESIGPLRGRAGRGRHRKPRPRRALFAVVGSRWPRGR